ncbi:methyltransferase [Metabacillus litoralis]|uniref:methyltransferase n=1 Tax=Metabacillus litoralis TaxID=152268 RepID=UPI001CFEC7DC|nr:methyltransferase [Metabacillus litoralis]
MIGKDYDNLLSIKTEEDYKGFVQSFHYHRYEPTPYEGLTYLFQFYELKSSDYVVDFGSGKGRLAFLIHYLFGATVVGIEMNEGLYYDAIENLVSYSKKMNKPTDTIDFKNCLAEKYEISSLDNRFYFFNPFSIQIFIKVFNNIVKSLEKYDREIELVLYYVSDDYIYYLENHPLIELKQEVTIPHLYEKNSNERFLIYRILRVEDY